MVEYITKLLYELNSGNDKSIPEEEVHFIIARVTFRTKTILPSDYLEKTTVVQVFLVY